MTRRKWLVKALSIRIKGDIIIFIGPGLWVTSFIYNYETSITYPLYETTRHFVLMTFVSTICLNPQSGHDHYLNISSSNVGFICLTKYRFFWFNLV